MDRRRSRHVPVYLSAGRRANVVDETDLETNVLEFVLKSFQFDRMETVGAVEYAIFHRTETESESQFRPKLVKLVLAVPRDWIVHDLASDLMLIAPDGVHPGHRGTGTAMEAGGEKAEFSEQGVDWVRRPRTNGGWVYLSKARRGELDPERPGVSPVTAAAEGPRISRPVPLTRPPESTDRASGQTIGVDPRRGFAQRWGPNHGTGAGCVAGLRRTAQR